MTHHTDLSWAHEDAKLITSPAAIATKLSMPTHQNDLYIQVK